jgi:hypothetical protein
MTNEPLTTALAKATALLRLLNDLHDDDPGDNEVVVAPVLHRARQQAQDLVDTLQKAVTR